MSIADPKIIRQCVRIAELGSLTRAAVALNLPQPWLSTRVRKYERELGFDIFDRSRRSISLTPQGEQFLGAARQFLDATERFVHAANAIAPAQRQVELLIGCPPAGSGVEERNEIIARFRAQSPHAIVRVLLLPPDQILEGLETGRLDLAFMIDPLPEAIDPRRVIAIRRQRAVILMPRAWKRDERETVDPKELRGREIAVMPVVLHPELCGPIYENLRQSGARLIEMTDDNFVALHAHAARNNIAALTVDGFCDSLALIRSHGAYLVEGDPFHANFNLVRPADGAKPEALDFWKLAEDLRADAEPA